MPLQIRRVVTGHNAEGRATVLIDETMSTFGQRPGAEGVIVWTTTGFPISNEGSEDLATRGPTWANGNVFRMLSMEAGSDGTMHRTDTIDYALVISGAVDMELDDGSTVHLNAGDTVVQRGTAHRWVNRGAVPCVMAFIMMQSVPVEGVPEIAH